MHAMPRTADAPDAPRQPDPMTMSPAAIWQEIKAIEQRDRLLLRLEKQIEQQHMDDTDRCLALYAALGVLTWPAKAAGRSRSAP
jgi:hypothetical protein